MSLIGTVIAFASGIAARFPAPNPDVEITRLKEELAAARLQVDVMRLALMAQHTVEQRAATLQALMQQNANCCPSRAQALR
jgi:hypothetical protein